MLTFTASHTPNCINQQGQQEWQDYLCNNWRSVLTQCAYEWFLLRMNDNKHHNCLWMYVCMYVCLFVCFYVSMFLCFYVSMFLCFYVCMYVCFYVSMFLCFYVCMFLCFYVCLYVCMFVCLMRQCNTQWWWWMLMRNYALLPSEWELDSLIPILQNSRADLTNIPIKGHTIVAQTWEVI